MVERPTGDRRGAALPERRADHAQRVGRDRRQPGDIDGRRLTPVVPVVRTDDRSYSSSSSTNNERKTQRRNGTDKVRTLGAGANLVENVDPLVAVARLACLTEPADQGEVDRTIVPRVGWGAAGFLIGHGNEDVTGRIT
jgi:hypothetical protein